VCLCICSLILTFFSDIRGSERYIQLHRVITKRNFIFYYIWQIIMMDDSILFWYVYNINVNLKSFVPFCWIADIFLSYTFLFVTQELKAKSFNARKRFQLAIICVRAVIRIKRLHITPEPLSTQVACTDPYRIKILRKVNSFT